jgi:hypothetical protein
MTTIRGSSDMLLTIVVLGTQRWWFLVFKDAAHLTVEL